MAITADPEQIVSTYHEPWIIKRIAMIQKALIGPAQQWYSHLSLGNKKNWQAFCWEFQENNQTNHQ